MEYESLHSSGVQENGPTNVEVIELTTKNDEKVHQYAPPGSPPNDTKDAHFIPQYHREPYQPSQPPANWPRSQRVYVATLTPWKTTVMVFDSILASLPIGFIVLAAMAAKHDGAIETIYSHNLAEVLKISPTIFPVIFAALMGRFCHHLGLYLAERGTTLGRLEHLIGCQSVASALERLVCLRSWSFVSIVSVLAWLLAPFGGQAALRVMKYHGTGPLMYNDTNIETMHYIDPLNTQESFLLGVSSMNEGRSTIVGIFLAALLSSANNLRMSVDGWGNVKIPTYRTTQTDFPEEWKPVTEFDSFIPIYSSLIGVPATVSASSAQALSIFSSFNIKARQFDITCSSNEKMSINESDFGDVTIATWKLSYTDPDLGCTAYPCSIISKSLAPGETEDDAYMVSVAHCEVSYGYFESEITCNQESGSCYAKKMRKLDLFLDGYTLENDDLTRSVVMNNLMAFMPTIDNYGTSNAGSRGSTNMEKWMANPEDFIGTTYENVALWNLTTDAFAEHFTQIWNSFYQSTYAPRVIARNMPTSEAITAGELRGTLYSAAPVTRTDMYPTYQTNWIWFTVLLVCSTVLLAAGYIGLVLKYLTLAPDIIGFASSLTLLNPYVPTPTGGTTLDGLERAALLHDLPIRIGDVCPNEPVGAIVLARADEGKVVRLDRRRLYM